ncbi:4'-phosphopantetheinyl transferase family protein [Streptacidiphilus sp. PAMC 29251]
MSSPDLWLLRVSDLSGDGPAADASALLALLDTSGAAELLNEDERASAAAFVRDEDRIRYAAAHIALRRLLAAATGRPAQDLVLIREPCPCCGELHGRPALADPPGPLHFSLSHGGDLVLIGIAAVPIGVDVEGLPGADAVAELVSVLHPGEQAELAVLPADQRISAFARLWTRKEAYLKAIGTGLGRDPAADYLGTGGLAATPAGWAVADLPTDDPTHAAAFAVQGGPAASAEVRLRPLSPAFVLTGADGD